MIIKFLLIFAQLYITSNGHSVHSAHDFYPAITEMENGISDGLSKAEFTNTSELENIGDFSKYFNQEQLPHLARSKRSIMLLNKILADFQIGQSNEDVYLNIEELVSKYGFRIEKHTVTTDDGYVLTLFRIPSNGPAVFLMHGLIGSADDFVIAGPDSGLAYLLAREGYDVWMGNARGNKHSRRHTYLRTTDPSFWDFSFHEIGVYDLPVMIDYVLRETNQKSLKYVGHSQGTTSFFVMASEKPQYNKKISLMVALSPVAFMSHAQSPLMKLALGVRLIGGIHKIIGHREFLPDSSSMRKMKEIFCGNGVSAQLFCSNIMFLAFGFDMDQVNATNVPVLLGHIPSGASTKQIVHFGQEIMSGYFRKYDYGLFGNMRSYGTVFPPNYQLNNVVAPVALFYSENDWLAHPIDVSKLYYSLSNVVEVYKVPYKMFNHIDFLFSKDVKTLIFERLRDILRLY